MTRVYQIMNDVNRYQYFLTENENDAKILRMDCTHRSETWVPPSVFIYEPMHKKGDFYNFSSGILICSPRAAQVLHQHLEIAGELLPLPYEDQEYTLLNVTECINCLDKERTVWECDDETGDKLWIRDYVFHRERFSESDIFKIPETHRGEILVVSDRKDKRDEFKYLVESKGLQGLVFKQIWEG